MYETWFLMLKAQQRVRVKTLVTVTNHNSTICVFFLLLGACMFWHGGHPQGVYMKISLKHTAVHHLLIKHYNLYKVLAF